MRINFPEHAAYIQHAYVCTSIRTAGIAYGQSWALNTFVFQYYIHAQNVFKYYFLNTFYKCIKYIEVFQYFFNTCVNAFLYYFQNVVLIRSIRYNFVNERNIRHKIGSIIQYVNNIAAMHVDYYITCWS